MSICFDWFFPWFLHVNRIDRKEQITQIFLNFPPLLYLYVHFGINVGNKQRN